jgi:hypothetical protein
VTTAVWILVTLLTPAEPDQVLLRFYGKVRPHVAGWRRIAALAPEVPQTRDLGQNLQAWLLGCAMVYAALFGIGKLCFGQIGTGMGLLGIALACAILLYRQIANRLGTTSAGGANA